MLFYREGLKCIFNDAPFLKFFHSENRVTVQNSLRKLFSIFNGDKGVDISADDFNRYAKAPSGHNHPLMCDDYIEIEWTVTRDGFPDWQISWNYWSRARLKKKESEDDVSVVFGIFLCSQ